MLYSSHKSGHRTLKELILQTLPHLPLPYAIFKHGLSLTEVSHRTWEVLHPTQTSQAPICLCLLLLHDLLQLKCWLIFCNCLFCSCRLLNIPMVYSLPDCRSPAPSNCPCESCSRSLTLSSTAFQAQLHLCRGKANFNENGCTGLDQVQQRSQECGFPSRKLISHHWCYL